MKQLHQGCFALAVLLLCGAAAPDDARAVFRKMQDALGGAENIAAVRDIEELVRAESWNGNTGESMGEVLKRTRWIRPSVLRIDQVGPGSTYVLYFDGDAGWEILPGTRQVVPIAGGELEFARKYIRTYRLNTWLADQDSNNRITLLSPNRIRISNSDALDQRDITLDPSLFLPMTIATVSLSDPAHPVASEETITEWGTVHGIRFPRRWTIFRNGVRVAEAHDARHTVNSGLRVADLAEKPRDLKPALPQ